MVKRRDRARRPEASGARPTRAVHLSPQAGLLAGCLASKGGRSASTEILQDYGVQFAELEPMGYPKCEQMRAQALLAIARGEAELIGRGLAEFEQDYISTAKVLVLTEAGREAVGAS